MSGFVGNLHSTLNSSLHQWIRDSNTSRHLYIFTYNYYIKLETHKNHYDFIYCGISEA